MDPLKKESVPLRQNALALAELEALTRTRLSSFLTLTSSRIPLQVSGFLQRCPKLGIELLQCPCQAMCNCCSLAIGTSALDLGYDIELAFQINGNQRSFCNPGKGFRIAIGFHVLTVDGEGAGAIWDQPHPGCGPFAPTCGD